MNGYRNRNCPRSARPFDEGSGMLHFDRGCATVRSGEKGTAMSKVKLVIVAALLVSSSGAFADAKYKRTQDIKVDVKLSDRVKPIQPKQQNKSEFKPELTADA